MVRRGQHGQEALTWPEAWPRPAVPPGHGTRSPWPLWWVEGRPRLSCWHTLSKVPGAGTGPRAPTLRQRGQPPPCCAGGPPQAGRCPQHHRALDAARRRGHVCRVKEETAHGASKRRPRGLSWASGCQSRVALGLALEGRGPASGDPSRPLQSLRARGSPHRSAPASRVSPGFGGLCSLGPTLRTREPRTGPGSHL